ncbi:MAG: porin [Bacteroidetes bacterium]|nr:porin [Bacteroidota bacterium]
MKFFGNHRVCLWLLRSASLVFFNFVVFQGLAQVVNTATMDTLTATVIGHLGIGGYVDTYYNYSVNKTPNNTDPFFVTNSQLNETNINLAYIDVRYKSSNMRARLVPGFGTYVNANYANERGSLKNIVEGNVGVRLSARRNIWFDVGVFGSPYTNESAISKDHLMYTRSLSAQNAPYYLSGARLTVPVNKQITATLFLLNGWQVIQDNNSGKSIGTQLEVRPNTRMLFNWDVYVGDERSAIHPEYRTRYFSDVYWIFQASKKFDATSCIYVGIQNRAGQNDATWATANFIGRYHFSDVLSLSGRVEYFTDQQGVFVHTQSGGLGFETYTTGLCLNYSPNPKALLRVEARQFISPGAVYLDSNLKPIQTNTELIASLTAWF